MQNNPHTLPPYVINLFFAVGLLSATAFRLLIIVEHLKAALFRPLWYFGIFGYIAFFTYRFAITQKRKKAIARFDLIAKIKRDKCLSREDKEALTYLLYSIKKSRENLNYLFIFATSALAVLADIVLAGVPLGR